MVERNGFASGPEMLKVSKHKDQDQRFALAKSTAPGPQSHGTRLLKSLLFFFEDA